MTAGTTVDAAAIEEAARRLADADRTRTPCAPVRDLIGATDVDAAYAVQSVNRDAAVAAGRRVVGRKIGLTAPAVQRQLGVDRPDFGYLYADMDVSDAPVDPGRLLQPKIEAEVAFLLTADLDGADGPLDAATVRAAAGRAVAALEIVDSRIARWDIAFGDTVADNASSGLYVLGEQWIDLGSDTDLTAVTMTLHVDGEQRSEGSGAACLGDPFAALAWLAEASLRHGDPLRAGQVVLSGALGPMVPVGGGDTVHAALTGLGAVSCSFAGSRS